MRLSKFLILSILIHFLILVWGNKPLQKTNGPPHNKRVELRVAKKTKEDSVRFSPNEISEVKENNKKLSAAKKIVKTPEITESQGKKEKRSEEEKIAKKTSKGKKVVKTRFKTQDDYQEYRKKMHVEQVKGLPVPDLVVVYSSEEEILAVTRYFNLRMIIYARKNDKEKPVMIEVGNSNALTFNQIQGIVRTDYSNRVREREGNPFFDNLLNKAVGKFGLEKQNSHLISLIPNDVDLYFRYKQIECARQNGIDPFSVKTTYARYHLTDIGVWILAVESMRLKDGRTVDVRDFELDEVKS